ncbi:MAG: family 1 glycosylhydrolase, partial [Armatimonadota bacterium]|nr:family 1 glycosylhydrolase [Armatimonadota bacterium]
MAGKQFPSDFRWGTATSSHQVEGDNTNNDWWAFEQQPGRIRNADRSGRACDWWRNAEADFDRMAALNQNAHRLSLEWSRLEPREGYFDDAAAGRYRQMLSGLRARGIEPMVTLNHFTLPLWVARSGGWENTRITEW